MEHRHVAFTYENPDLRPTVSPAARGARLDHAGVHLLEEGSS